MMKKRLYKSKDDEKLCGVCSGIAKYLDIDPTLIRLIWVLVTLCGGAGILAYFICAIVIPDEPDNYVEYTNVDVDRE